MNWVPQEADIKGVLELLHESQSSDTHVQRRVQEVRTCSNTIILDFE